MSNASPPSLEHVKIIDQDSKDCVNGYVRELQELFPSDAIYYTIPPLIIHWILLYFYIWEKFDADNCCSNFKICNQLQNKTVTKTSSNPGAAYLTNIIKSGVHFWKFKLIRLNKSGWSITIGVWRNNHSKIINKLMSSFECRRKVYGWRVNYNLLCDIKTFSGIARCYQGDTVEMLLDLNQKELKYSKNNGKMFTAYTNIEDTSYTAVVCAYCMTDCIQLISYECLSS